MPSARAAAVRTAADLAALLRDLRQRAAGADLSYRQIAHRTGTSAAAVGAYLTGTRVPPADRLRRLAALFGADAAEQAALAAARERVVSGRTAPAPAGLPAPRTLPAPVSGFVGRAAQLAALDRLAEPAVVVAVTGMGGVGKTAFTVHWGHRAADRFPAGQLYVDLHGFGPGPALSTMDALGVLLSGLTVDLPPDLAGRSALYHRLLRDRALLVVLDNAAGGDQVRPLLPPAPCVTVVTSRDDLRSLDARHVPLDVLPAVEAAALLHLLIGERVDHEPGAARRLAGRCGCLPLALRVAAAHALGRPLVPLSRLVTELGGEPVNLDVLETAGDGRTDVRTVFSWSVRGLPGAAARAFRLFGLLPGTDVDGPGLAALIDGEPAEAERLGTVLAAASLVERRNDGRYGMHDLLRAYAGEVAVRDLTAAERHAATTRLLDHYLATATAAIDARFPLNRSSRPPMTVPAARPSAPDLTDAGAASAWLAAERTNLVRACGHAARNGWPHHAIRLALVLWPFLDGGFYDDALTVHSAALAAADSLGTAGEPAQRAGIHGGLGITHWRLGRLDRAAEHLATAFAGNVRAGNAGGATVNMAALGLVRDGQGRYPDAIACQRRGLAVARAAGILVQQGIQLVNLGYAHLRTEEYAVAADLYREACGVFESGGERWGVAQARAGLAAAAVGLGRYDEALSEATEALAVNRSFGHVVYGIRALITIGSVYRRLGRLDEAFARLDEALAECRKLNNPRPTASVLNALGETYGPAGDPERALACHREALDLADRCGDRWEHARALVGAGDALAAYGDDRSAREHWHRAHRFYRTAGLPAADRVLGRLSR
jgi:tetratricopeptide (TPR) repeat protein/transcriptional regulator with XRE-family HTH domain